MAGITSFSFQMVATQNIEFKNISGYSLRVFFFSAMKTVDRVIGLHDHATLSPYSFTPVYIKSERGHMIIYDLLNQIVKHYLVKILQNALRVVERSVAKLLSVRLSMLLYEALARGKPLEEFIYAASNEYFPWSHTPPDRNPPLYMSYLFSLWADLVARHLTRMVSGGFVRV